MCWIRAGVIARVQVGGAGLFNRVVTSGNETTAVVENLYPTSTFEVKVVALSGSKEYCMYEVRSLTP